MSTALPRREFVARVSIAIAGTALACRENEAPSIGTVDIGSLQNGQGLISTLHGSDGAPILVARVDARRFTALSTICTHEGCPVNAPVAGIITCPCHGSQYDLEGHVLRGPAQYPLTRYQVRLDSRRGSVTLTNATG